MEYNRDFSVIVLNAYKKYLAPVQDFYVVEPLTATGVRSLRYALEVEGDLKLLASDIDDCAVKLARDNVELNGLHERIIVLRKDARELLYATRWLLDRPPLVIDIDPFGTPAPYLESAISVIGNKGMLAVTATDLAVLEGSKSKAARRRYGVRVRNTPESKEVGLRILLGYIARVAASHDKAIRPLSSYYADHYYRVYVQVVRGARIADKMLEESIGYAYYYPSEKRTYILRDPPSCTSHDRPVMIGPLWVSRINDPGFIERLNEVIDSMTYLHMLNRIKHLLDILKCEADLEEKNLHVRVEQAASYAKTSMPRVDRLIALLRNRGYQACRSHYSPTSIRTDAGYKDITSIIRLSQASG